jgi:hypothetical protein
VPTYTCQDYRLEMILLGLQRRLKDPDLTEEEKKKIRIEIRNLEEQMNL